MNLTTTSLQLGLVLASLPALAGPPTVAGPPPPQALEFVANQRQWDKPVLFAADVPAGRLFLEHGRLVQALYDGKQVEELHHKSATTPAGQRIRAHAYSTTFVGASVAATVKGKDQLPGVSNYFLGNDQSRWASNVPGYGEVRYEALYPGIDLHFYSKERVLEYDFEVAAGADATRIALRYAGQTKLSVLDGALHIGTSVGTVVEQRPYAYQLVNGKRQRVACEYALSAGNTVKFSLPKGYNHALPLVIDPVLVYSSYTGSTSNFGYTATYDAQGNLYAGGSVFGPGYPTTVGAYDVLFASGIDMGIMKFNPAAATGPASRVYATYVGGSDDDHPHSLVVDSGNNLIILGSTTSTNYPFTTGAYDTTLNGNADIVVTKLNPAGTALVGSTCLGGSGLDGQLLSSSVLRVNYGDQYRGDVTVDQNNNIYLASMTSSANFPTTSAAFQRTSGGGASDGVVSKFNPSLTALTWSSYLGGAGADAAYSLQLDSLSNLYVGGGTSSTNFPGAARGFHGVSQGGTSDGFVSWISPAGDDLVQSTYIGTSAYDQVHFIQLNRQGEVYAFGQTAGAYPVSAGVYSNPGSRQYIQKLNPQLTTSIFSTVIGNGASASPSMSPTAFLVDNCGQILLSGWTLQGQMPVTADALQATGSTGTTATTSSFSGYFYIAQLSASAQTLVYGTYFGNGSCHVDGGTSRFDKRGIIYQSMCAGGGSNTVITTPNAWSRTNPGGYNNAAFKMDVLQLSATFVPTITSTSTLRITERCAPATFFFNRPSATGTSTLWDFGNGQTSTQANNTSTTYAQPGKYAVRLTVFDVNNCLQSVTSVDTVVVYAVPQPRVAASGRQTICTGSSITLSATNQTTATPNVTYTWTAPGQPTRTGATITVTPAVTTRYTVTISTPASVGGCFATDTVTVKVSSRLAVSAGPARTICAGTPTILTVPDFGAGATYTWTAPGQPTLTGRTVTVSPSASVRYLVRIVNALGCQGRDSVQINMAPPLAVSAGPARTICAGSPTILSVADFGAGATYTWTAPGQPTLTGRTVTVSPTVNTRYLVRIVNPAGCQGRDSVQINMAPPLAVSAGPARTICAGSPTTLTVADFGAGATYTWTAPGQPTLTGQTVTVSPTTSIRYLVRIANAGGCQGRDSVQITIAPLPRLAATVSSPNLVNKAVIFINTTTGATSYRWDFGDNSATSTEVNPTHVYTTPSPLAAPYQARLTAIYGPGCETSLIVPVPVRGFDRPNVITPNGDGQNDTFRPFVTNERVDVEIFNRWGRKVFEQKNYTDGWGDPSLAAGVYYYRLASPSGESWKGWVEVVK